MASKAQQKKFNKSVEKAILELGGTLKEELGFLKRFSLQTKAGNLEISLHEAEASKLFTIFSRFDDPKLANEVLSTSNKSNLNNFSGKWNFHYLGAQSCLDVFLFSLKEIEASNGISGLYDLRIPFGSGLSMNEAISRAIRDCFLRHNGKLNKKSMDETIKAVGKNTPEYKKAWKEFKATFEIKAKGGKYINPFHIV